MSNTGGISGARVDHAAPVGETEELAPDASGGSTASESRAGLTVRPSSSTLSSAALLGQLNDVGKKLDLAVHEVASGVDGRSLLDHYAEVLKDVEKSGDAQDLARCVSFYADHKDALEAGHKDLAQKTFRDTVDMIGTKLLAPALTAGSKDAVNGLWKEVGPLLPDQLRESIKSKVSTSMTKWFFDNIPKAISNGSTDQLLAIARFATSDLADGSLRERINGQDRSLIEALRMASDMIKR